MVLVINSLLQIHFLTFYTVLFFFHFPDNFAQWCAKFHVPSHKIDIFAVLSARNRPVIRHLQRFEISVHFSFAHF